MPRGCDRDSGRPAGGDIGFGPTPGLDQNAGVDLHRWIIEEHRSVWRRFADGIVDRVPTDRWTEHADGGGSTIGFLVFHTAVHADYSGRTVCRGLHPLLDGHREALGLDGMPADRGVAEAEDADIVASLSMPALLGYARAVHENNAAWLEALRIEGAVAGKSTALETIPPASDRLTDLTGMAPEALPWLRTMWADKPIWWHLQWEVTGHLLNHVGEMVAVRNRMGLSPF